MKVIRPTRLIASTLVLLAPTQVHAGLIAYGICQTSCNILAVACYGAAGAVFGTIAAPVAPPAILACNAALGTCMGAICAPLLLIPFI
ncbi:hypothetical protein BKA62DRAFT_719469 [Auriculariales sp. MPI-PUGE-AT-0066]|nr:hypothetical protein BKA62DRAFT_719469 [Auriculariales sp. MPI-PUGE-AT-0066]